MEWVGPRPPSEILTHSAQLRRATYRRPVLIFASLCSAFEFRIQSLFNFSAEFLDSASLSSKTWLRKIRAKTRNFFQNQHKFRLFVL